MAQASKRTGFALIEVMIALVIVAITTSLAFASYRRHLLHGHRVEAVQALLAAAAEQEKFHLAQGRYSDRIDSGYDDEPPGLPVASMTTHRKYGLAIEYADAARFRIVATPLEDGGQGEDLQCRRLSIDESGRREALDTSGNDSTSRCW